MCDQNPHDYATTSLPQHTFSFELPNLLYGIDQSDVQDNNMVPMNKAMMLNGFELLLKDDSSVDNSWKSIKIKITLSSRYLIKNY